RTETPQGLPPSPLREPRRERFRLARENAGVVADADKQTADLEPVPGIGLDRREDAGTLSGRAYALNRVLDLAAHVRMTVVAQMTHARRQMARADEQAVDTIDGGNRFDAGDGLRCFDLDDDAHFVVRAMEVIFRAPVAVRANRRRDSTNAVRWIARRGN